jgi:16S rRNA (adenine1518-N6/adenine1519-N6)-dimethyltransferase
VTRARESCGVADTPDPVAKLRPAGALALAGVIPHKSKGQNFLVQPRVADRIVAAAEITRGDDVIEIGPGLGILSERLARQPLRRLILIELDHRLTVQLRERYADDVRVTVINADFLTCSAADYVRLEPPDRSKLEPDKFPHAAPLRVVANLPFNVAAAILERLCGMQALIARMVLMFQREVAERIRARPGSSGYGALSAFTSLYWNVTGHFRVAAGSFHPKPKVDAEVLTFAPRRPLSFAPAEERAVLATVRAAFSAPRKTLRNAVGKALAIESAALATAFARAAIDPTARAATLPIEDFVRLARALDSHPDPETDHDAGAESDRDA